MTSLAFLIGLAWGAVGMLFYLGQRRMIRTQDEWLQDRARRRLEEMRDK